MAVAQRTTKAKSSSCHVTHLNFFLESAYTLHCVAPYKKDIIIAAQQLLERGISALQLQLAPLGDKAVASGSSLYKPKDAGTFSWGASGAYINSVNLGALGIIAMELYASKLLHDGKHFFVFQTRLSNSVG